MASWNGPKILIVFGVGLLVLGLLWQNLGSSFHFGRLPGDIAIERENFKFYFPLTSSIVASVVLSLVFWLVERFWS